MRWLDARHLSGRRLSFALLLLTVALLVAMTEPWRARGQGGSNPVTTVSAASFAPIVAPDAIAAAFGARLATQTAVAPSQPLPTSLAGTTVKVNNVLAQLFFVSPTQINYVIPSGTASGAASVVVTSGDGTVSTGTAQMSAVAPAVFSANASGAGVPAAVLIRVKTDGTQVFESVAQLDPTTNLFVPKPISFGASGERLFLILYLCGIRNAPDTDGNPSNGVAENIRVMFGGNAVTPLFAGAAPGFTGLDQINVELGRSLNGRVSAQVEFTSITSNITEIEMAAPGRAATTLTLSSSAATPVYGQAVTFTAQVNAAGGTATGAVIFRDGATTLGVSSLNAGRGAHACESARPSNGPSAWKLFQLDHCADHTLRRDIESGWQADIPQ